MTKKVKLGEFVEVDSGFAFKSKLFNDNEGIPIIRIRDVNSGKSNTYYSGEYAEKYVVNNGDLLITMDGEFKIKEWDGGKALLNQRVCRIKSKTNLLIGRYLLYLLPKVLKDIEDKTPFVTVKHLSVKDIVESEVYIPSHTIQEKIVEALDLCQSLIVKRKAQIEALSDLTQSVFLEMFGDPIVIQKKWPNRPLGDFLDRIASGWSPKCESFPAKEGENGVLKLSAVKKGEYNFLENKALYADTPFKPEFEVKKDDLLVTRKNTRELVGTCAYVFDTPPKLMLPDTIFKLVFKTTQNQLCPIFLWGLLNNDRFRIKVTSLAEGSSGSMPNISKKNLLKLNIVIPPIEIQNQYKEIIIKLKKQKELLNKGLLILEHNFSSLMQLAFKGELFND